MFFLLTFIFLGFLVLVNVYGHKKPILYLINTILLVIIAALDFTQPGKDWINTFWGVLMLVLAMYWGNLYLKLR